MPFLPFMTPKIRKHIWTTSRLMDMAISTLEEQQEVVLAGRDGKAV